MGRVSLLLNIVVYATDNIQFPLIGRLAFGDGLGDVLRFAIHEDAIEAQQIPANVSVILLAVVVLTLDGHSDQNGIVQGVGFRDHPCQPLVLGAEFLHLNGLWVVVRNGVNNRHRVTFYLSVEWLVVSVSCKLVA